MVEGLQFSNWITCQTEGLLLNKFTQQAEQILAKNPPNSLRANLCAVF